MDENNGKGNIKKNLESLEKIKSNDNKIIINSKLDLNKIPLNTIIHGNLFNFEGEYFKKLYEKAEKEENKEYNNNLEIKEDIILPNKLKNNENNQEQLKKEEKNDNNENIKKIKKVIINKNSKSDNVIKERPNKNLLNNNKPMINLNFKINIIKFEIKFDTKLGENISVIGSIDKLGNWDTSRALHLDWNEKNIWVGSFDYNDTSEFEYKFILVDNGYVKEWEDGINRKFTFHQIKSLIEPNLTNGKIIKIKNIMNQNLEYDYNIFSLKIVSEWNKK